MKKLTIPESIFKVSFPLIAITATIVLSILKIQSFHAWQYTSDVFHYDHFLNELIFHGHPINFRYGNLLGDHAYLFLYLLTPLKLLLKDNHIYLLLLLNPILYLVTALLLFNLTRRLTDITNSFFISIAYLAGFGILYRGLLEGIYGFHPDIGAGFLIIAATFFFILDDQSKTDQRGWLITASILSTVYLLTKEETAILGIIYFSLLYVGTRKKKISLVHFNFHNSGHC